jgi:tRNA (guanine26-N2/guanine27-N2)-dimethyltransferase
MWAGSLHNVPFLANLTKTIQSLDESIYKTRPRMLGMISLAAEELDVPFYRTSQDLAHTLKANTPQLDLMWSAILNAGYKVSSTHCVAGAFKTDAPPNVIWDIMREWVKTHPVRMNRISDSSPGYKILTTPSTYVAEDKANEERRLI